MKFYWMILLISLINKNEKIFIANLWQKSRKDSFIKLGWKVYENSQKNDLLKKVSYRSLGLKKSE